jgi:hypothetical protein
MIITQKFHSVHEIDEEFIPTLEELLGGQVPSFDWIKSYEDQSPESTHFTYYLFFGNKHNSPIGYAQMALRPQEAPKTPWWKKIFGTKQTAAENYKSVEWNLFNRCEGIVFEPRYIKPGMLKAQELFQEYQTRSDIGAQIININEHHSVARPTENFEVCPSFLTFIKSCENYQEYINQLGQHNKEFVEALWREGNKVYSIGEYPSFKEVFQYKNARELYRELKKHPTIAKYYPLRSSSFFNSGTRWKY